MTWTTSPRPSTTLTSATPGPIPSSAAADRRARKVLPGGNTRSVLHFDPFPFRVVRAEGATLTDVDGHTYVDFCGNYTAGLLGHSPVGIQRVIADALEHGWAIGATHRTEIELAELLCDRFATIEQVRFTNSGTEANLMAIGTALHHTGRTGVGAFDHAYHGGVLSFGDGGVQHPLNVPHRFVVAPFDDLDGLDVLFADDDLGCVLIEAVQGSGGCRPASAEFLTELERRCRDNGTVLILDEVMTSRLAPGGAQELFGLAPDMTTLGKYIAGGMTFGAFGGKRSLMSHFDPAAGGTLTQAGTFNNNIVSMTAAVHTLRHELEPDRLGAVNERGDSPTNRSGQCVHRRRRPVVGDGARLDAQRSQRASRTPRTVLPRHAGRRALCRSPWVRRSLDGGHRRPLRPADRIRYYVGTVDPLSHRRTSSTCWTAMPL